MGEGWQSYIANWGQIFYLYTLRTTIVCGKIQTFRQRNTYTWYYGDMILSWTFNVIARSGAMHVQMQCTWLTVPDTDSCMACSTDADSHVTCSKRYCFAFYKLCAAARLPHWLSHTLAWVRCMISKNLQPGNKSSVGDNNNKVWISNHSLYNQ